MKTGKQCRTARKVHAPMPNLNADVEAFQRWRDGWVSRSRPTARMGGVTEATCLAAFYAGADFERYRILDVLGCGAMCARCSAVGGRAKR